MSCDVHHAMQCNAIHYAIRQNSYSTSMGESTAPLFRAMISLFNLSNSAFCSLACFTNPSLLFRASTSSSLPFSLSLRLDCSLEASCARNACKEDG